MLLSRGNFPLKLVQELLERYSKHHAAIDKQRSIHSLTLVRYADLHGLVVLWSIHLRRNSTMLPFLISKTKLLPIRSKHKDTAKDKSSKEKSFFVTGDTLATLKTRRVRRNTPKLPAIVKPGTCDCGLMHLTRIVISYAPKSRKRGASNIVLSMTAWGTTGQRKRMKLPSVKLTRKLVNGNMSLTHNSDEFFKKLEVMWVVSLCLWINGSLYSFHLN